MESQMKEVTREEFFKKIGPMDVLPRPEKDASYWHLPNMTLVGISKPGYM